MLSRTGEYALRAAVLLARNPGAWPIPSAWIAREAAIPAKYLSKILLDLVRAGVLKASRGRGGGFALARPAGQVRLCDVLAPFGSLELLRAPFADSKQIEDIPSPARLRWQRVLEAQEQFLCRTTLEDVAGVIGE